MFGLRRIFSRKTRFFQIKTVEDMKFAKDEKVFPCQLFIADLYHQNKLLDWQSFKDKLNLTQKDYFGWRKIIAAIPKSWKKLISENNIFSEIPKTQHIIKLTRSTPLEKLTSKYLYMLSIHRVKKPAFLTIKYTRKNK